MAQAKPQAAADSSRLQQSYDHVVMIDDKHVAEAAGNYLVDIPLVEHPDSNYVFFLGAHVPVAPFTATNTFYPDIREFTLIVPDWKYYHEVAVHATKNKMCAEPVTTNIYYHIRRGEGTITVDSIRVQGEQPKLQYITPHVPVDTLIVYRSESYGSACCPEDPQWKRTAENAAMIKDFERQHKVAITGTYRQNSGKEGEHTDYYTLPGLTPKQRLDFVLARRWQWIVNKETKNIVFKPQFFTPMLIPVVKEGFRAMRDAASDQ
ncbi:hypothetical protein HHL17_10920 [Chitinophaga sp. G-6-1-13]|uniref:Uncharacterized protein n=1 Tax=Chitinophaga fulva TaxID=2728842 RepID=A0A848GGC9_9BACT|nr:hypothetical protein [Chitinophaga fulva]NML37705.1 hypothetical protein [Chitinophaga fulva]